MYGYFIFKTRSEAEDALTSVIDILENYGKVTIDDICGIVGLSSSFLNTKYGWRDLGLAKISEEGYYYTLNLPDPIRLDINNTDTIQPKNDREIKKPIICKYFIKVYCSVCGWKLADVDRPKHCPKCGNALDWNRFIEEK